MFSPWFPSIKRQCPKPTNNILMPLSLSIHTQRFSFNIDLVLKIAMVHFASPVYRAGLLNHTFRFALNRIHINLFLG